MVYSDSSFNNREEGKSQLRFLILLATKNKKCTIIHYSSKKSQGVTRSSMAAETLAFVNAFDSASVIKHNLKRMLGVSIPMPMLTASEPLFGIITRSRCTTERRLEIDIAAAREAYVNREK